MNTTGALESSFESSLEPFLFDLLATLSDFQVEFPLGIGDDFFGLSSESSLSRRLAASCLILQIDPYCSLITTLNSSS